MLATQGIGDGRDGIHELRLGISQIAVTLLIANLKRKEFKRKAQQS